MYQALRKLDSTGVRVGPDGEVAERHGLPIIRVGQLLAAVSELRGEQAGDAVDVPAQGKG